jgi:catechol 2,3-dioxygenase-like lactoylglutathione lyase family enzyme
MPGNEMGFLHINVNCSNLDRAIEFYKLIGFRELQGPDGKAVGDGGGNFGEVGLGPVLGVPDNSTARFRIMQYGDNPMPPYLDLIEWKDPHAPAQTRTMWQPGFARMALAVKSCQEVYDRLKVAGHVPYTEPKLIDMKPGNFYVFCCEDPDGTVMEFMEILPLK